MFSGITLVSFQLDKFSAAYNEIKSVIYRTNVRIFGIGYIQEHELIIECEHSFVMYSSLVNS